MSIHPGHLREYVIRPVLRSLDLYSEAAEELLMLTAATESLCGRYLHQVGGPALGIFQMEPRTHNDIHTNYLSYRPGLARLVAEYGHTANQLAGSLNYATAMARIHYLRVPAPLPSPGDVDGLANYWKTYFNTSAGAGRPETAVRHYQSLALTD